MRVPNVFVELAKFLSTPSARRATENNTSGQKTKKISIHALREEGDSIKTTCEPSLHAFLSTPSARRATYVQDCYQVIVNISIHALREEGDPAIGPPPFSGYRFLSTPSARRATACLLPQPYQ